MQRFWHIMLYYFKEGKNATEMQKVICAVYGEGAVTDRTCQKWFEKFRAGDFSLDNAPRSGRPVEVDNDHIETLIENNQCQIPCGRWLTYKKIIQINKVVGENEKCVFYFTEKNKKTFWAIQNYFVEV